MRAVATAAGGSIQSPWFTAAEAAAYLRIESADGSLHAFYLAYPRMRITAYRFDGGRSLRFHQDELDAALRRARTADDAGVTVTDEVKRASEPRLPKSPRSNQGSAPSPDRGHLQLAASDHRTSATPRLRASSRGRR